MNTRTWWNAVRFAWDAGELGRPWFGGGRLVLLTVVHDRRAWQKSFSRLLLHPAEKGPILSLLPERAHNERALSSGGERFPDTEEVTSSNLVAPTIHDLCELIFVGSHFCYREVS